MTQTLYVYRYLLYLRSEFNVSIYVLFLLSEILRKNEIPFSDPEVSIEYGFGYATLINFNCCNIKIVLVKVVLNLVRQATFLVDAEDKSVLAWTYNF